MRKNIKFVFLLAIIFASSYLIYISGFLPLVDYKIFDLINGKNDENNGHSNSVVIVQIDEKSLKEFGQWPWNRILVAKLVQEILLSRPAVLGIDIIFSEKDRTSLNEIKKFYDNGLNATINLDNIPQTLLDNDKILASSLSRGKSVLPIFISPVSVGDEFLTKTYLKTDENFTQIPKATNFLGNYEMLNDAASALGFINSKSDNDGILRQNSSFLYYRDKLVPSLSMAMLMQVDPKLSLKKSALGLEVEFLGKKAKLNENAKSLSKVHSSSDFTKISASDILLANVDKSEFTGKFVLLGATATGLYDQFISTKGEIVPGIFFHASFLENFLTGNLITQPNLYKNLSFYTSLFLLVFMVFLISKYDYLYSFILFILLSVLAIVLALAFLKYNIYISLGYFLLPFVFIFLNISLIVAFLTYLDKKEFIKELESAHSATIDSMVSVIEGKDVETGTHIVRSKEYVKLLAQYLYKQGFHLDKLNPKFIEILYRATPLHDIGKVAIPDKILNKSSNLDEQEWEVMKKHTVYGKEIIEKAISSSNATNEFLLAAINIAYTHHERWDGQGYPRGLKGDEIPIEGRLMALADVYDALISKRHYKEAFSYEKAEDFIVKNKGSHFDPMVVDAFVALKKEFKKVALKEK
ncbi:CHASE2 domain-containing protein [Campylobacter geochelonis]|uniref:Cyclic di-GMP phosphodiesterase response regulator RpfG n=1 Tax=Campylobacter geochelonis TaxID=1780362 RepID=A0A128EB46_9BACT|nr:CHASE2 domain-containing protein [Campylobacter geochelonis]QKF70492.1 CHASE2 sensor-containing response regulator c-di-GMP phosphodiesterase, RpfG family [Campylobacter geochelonis]CZE46175.1 Cyclic di-GMP phosphodiesterase response regulator RpfG [Campylobacter geochelonis]